jgi:hypothetical protein
MKINKEVYFVPVFLLFSISCLLFLSGSLLPDYFYGEHRISLKCSKGIPCAFFIPYPDGVSAVKAAAACGVQVIFRHVIPAAIAASQNSMFAENKLPGKVQILFKAVLFIVPTIQFIEVQYFTQFIIGLLYI